MSNKSIKKRNWTFLVYPESAPENWKQILAETGLPCCISPLHDKDVNEGTGELKKAHYHVILCYSGPTTYSVVCKLCEELNAPIPKPIDSVKGIYEYFWHKNNPEKYQYEKSDITYINNFDISDYSDYTKSELNRLIKDIHQIILSENIFEYSDLLDYLLKFDDSNELYGVASSHTLLFNSYITSRRHKLCGGSDRSGGDV